MYTKIFKHVFIITFLLLFQIIRIKESELIELNDQPELRNLIEDTFGLATLRFDSSGNKSLINVNDDLNMNNIEIYLKKGINLTIISDSDLSVEKISSNQIDTIGSIYYVNKVSYNLNNTDDEIVVNFKSKLTSFKGLFAFSEANYITLEKFQTDEIVTMEFMFLECVFLKEINFGGMNTSNVQNLFGLFKGCSSLTQLDISNWDTSNVIRMDSMFSYCLNLTQLNISRWDTSRITNIQDMFYACSSLTQLDISNWCTSNVISMDRTFSNCLSLTQLDISSWDTSSVETMDSTFSSCVALTQLDISGWSTSKVTGMDSTFSNCLSLTQLILSSWITSNVKDMRLTFYGCSALTQLDISNWDTSSVTNMKSMFSKCSSLTQLDISNWNTSSVTNMESMFSQCSSLIKLNVSSWKTSSLSNTQYMFQHCEALIQLNLSNWNTSMLNFMSYMFQNCSSLTQLNVLNWNTSKVLEMGSVFQNCSKLTQLNVSNWKTSNVLYMDKMFQNCISLSKLDLSNWNTSGLFKIDRMLQNCKSLKDLNIESFNQIKITQAESFLGNDDNLEYCRYSGYSLSNMTKYFLRKCSKLIAFKKCYPCDATLNDALCEITLTVGTGDGSGSSESITKIFHYLEEEKFLNQSERSCYWIAGLENLSYFNKSLVDEYHYIICDESCKSCVINAKMCEKCNDGFYSLFNETTQEQKYCYNELTKNEHFYLYNSTGYRECPSECRTCKQKSNETSINCLSCNGENRIIFDGNCIKIEEVIIKETLNYTYEDLINNKKIYDSLLNYSNTYYADSIFIQHLLNTNITLTLYNVGTNNMNNSYLDQLNLNILKVNLSDCYEKIVQESGINYDLIYAQVDFLDSSNRVNYILFDPKTNETINMNICEDTDITISKNVELTEEMRNIINNANEQGYNIADINDPFYNDVCTPYTTANGTDITLSDRVKDIYDANSELFGTYGECSFEIFNVNESNATITCKSKAKTNFFDEIKDFSFDTKQLVNSFKFCDSSNFYVVKCYKEFLSKEGQKDNYANYTYYVIGGLVIILLIIYSFTGLNYLQVTLVKIIIKKKFNDISKRKSSQNQCNEGNSKKSDFIAELNNVDFSNIKNQHSDKELNHNTKEENKYNPPIKVRLNKKKKSIKLNSNENENESKSPNSQIILVKKNTKNIEDENKKENKENAGLETESKEENENGEKTQKITEEEKKDENIQKQKIENQLIENKKEKNTEKINIKNMTEIDFNEFDYEVVHKYDKRTLKQIYLSYIHLKHPLISLFYDNYNIYAVKYILYLQSFGTHICMNGLFFRENTMHRIYIDNGSFDFLYRLPLTLYSVVISAGISFLLKKLVLTQSCIIGYKKEVAKLKNKDEAVKKAIAIIRYYKIKFIIFVVLIILIFAIFWFYIGCFCTVYHNTQFYLLKDSLIGFALSMLYPFGILFLAGLLRMAALHNNYVCLYIISKMIA